MRTAVRWAVSSAGRALPSQGRGREFKSPTVHRLLGHYASGRLAQRESAVFTRQKSQVQILYRPLGKAKSKYDQETRDLLDEVYAVYGQFAAWKLRNMTHKEPPWCNSPEGYEITHDALRAYFSGH